MGLKPLPEENPTDEKLGVTRPLRLDEWTPELKLPDTVNEAVESDGATED